MSVELGSLQYSELEKLLKQHFVLSISGNEFQVELAEVKKLSPLPPGFARTHAFSVTFKGPLEKRLGQGCVDLEHPELGRLENVLIVPVAEKPDGFFYEAVFG